MVVTDKKEKYRNKKVMGRLTTGLGEEPST